MTSEVAQKLKGKPFYMVPGNHEIQDDEGPADRYLYTKFFGPAYYWFGYGHTLFIGLDSSEEKIGAEQFKWLNQVMDKVRPHFKYCVIYTHVPPFNPKYPYTRHLDKVSALKLAEILKKYKVDLLLFGHVHYFYEGEFAGVPMYTLPSSGQPIRSDILKYGYVEAKIGPKGVEKVKVRYIDDGRAQEEIENFFSTVMIRNSIRTAAFWLVAIGALLAGWGILAKKRR